MHWTFSISSQIYDQLINYTIVQLLTLYAWTAQRSIELLLGAALDLWGAGPPPCGLAICANSLCHLVISSEERLFASASSYRPSCGSILLNIVWYCDEITVILTGFLKVGKAKGKLHRTHEIASLLGIVRFCVCLICPGCI